MRDLNAIIIGILKIMVLKLLNDTGMSFQYNMVSVFLKVDANR